MTDTTYSTTKQRHARDSRVESAPFASNIKLVESRMDESVSLYPLNPEDVLRALMTREITEDPEAMASLERARQQSERGEGRWLDNEAPASEDEDTSSSE